MSRKASAIIIIIITKLMPFNDFEPVSFFRLAWTLSDRRLPNPEVDPADFFPLGFFFKLKYFTVGWSGIIVIVLA